MKTHKQKQVGLSSQRGVALVAVMLTLLLVTAMAAALVLLSNTETSTSSNFSDEQRAFFAAKAGIEEARDRLRQSSGIANYSLLKTGSQPTLPTSQVGAGSTTAPGVIYITNPLGSETVAPWCGSSANINVSTGINTTCAKQYPDDELCQEAHAGLVTCTTDSTTGKVYASGSSYYYSITSSSTLQPGSGTALDWKWVRITQKQSNAFGSGYYVNGNSASTTQVFWNGTGECTSGSLCTMPVYVLTALAVTPSGSRRMVQMEVAQDQLNFTAPAALTLDGTSDAFSGGNANGWAVVGTDTSVGCGGGTSAAVPAVGVSDGTPASGSGKTAVAATGDIANVINGYGSGSGIPNKNLSSYVGLGAAPDVENVSSTYAGDKLDTVSDITSLVSTLKNDITQPVVASGTKISGGGAIFNSSASSPQIVYANGDLTISGSGTGYGILVVTGNLTFKGTVQWNGLILVVGAGNFQTDGTNSFYGAVVVANTSSGSIGTPTFGVNGGGNGGVNYSSACVAQATQLTTYHSVSFRELIN
jgi:Tfp pilus assembly protein PilX